MTKTTKKKTGKAGPKPRPARKPKGALNDKQRRFAAEYLIDLNATQAAIRAGYSSRSAHVQAHELLKNPKIQTLVQDGKNRRAAKLEITADRVLKEIARLAFADHRNFFAADGGLKPIHELDDDTAASLAGFEVEDVRIGSGEGAEFVRTRKIKTYDKTRSLEQLGKYMKLFTEKHEHSGPDGAPLQAGPLVITGTLTPEEWLKALQAKQAAEANADAPA